MQQNTIKPVTRTVPLLMLPDLGHASLAAMLTRFTFVTCRQAASCVRLQAVLTLMQFMIRTSISRAERIDSRISGCVHDAQRAVPIKLQ